MILRFIYSAVEYDVIYKAGVDGIATQAEPATSAEARAAVLFIQRMFGSWGAKYSTSVIQKLI